MLQCCVYLSVSLAPRVKFKSIGFEFDKMNIRMFDRIGFVWFDLGRDSAKKYYIRHTRNLSIDFFVLFFSNEAEEINA